MIADIRPAAFGETTAILVAIESRDQASYLSEQGGAAAALHTTAARNLRAQADETVYILTTGDADGYVAYERVGAVDATLVATVVGRAS